MELAVCFEVAVCMYMVKKITLKNIYVLFMYFFFTTSEKAFEQNCYI